MPVLDWDEQDLSRRQDAGQERGLGKLRELLQIRMLHVHLKRAQESPAQPPEREWVGGGRGRSCDAHLAGVVEKVCVMRIQSLRLLWGIQPDVLPSDHLGTATP